MCAVCVMARDITSAAHATARAGCYARAASEEALSILMTES